MLLGDPTAATHDEDDEMDADADGEEDGQGEDIGPEAGDSSEEEEEGSEEEREFKASELRSWVGAARGPGREGSWRCGALGDLGRDDDGAALPLFRPGVCALLGLRSTGRELLGSRCPRLESRAAAGGCSDHAHDEG